LAEHDSEPPLVSVVVPTHNRKNAAKRCVESILQSRYPQLQVIVVDDASTDGTSGHLSVLFPSITLIRSDKSGLVSHSRNLGCKQAKGKLVFLVDDDNVVHPDAITELVRAITSDSRNGIAGPVMYYFSDPERVWCSGVSRNYLTSTTRFLTVKPDGTGDPYSTEDIPNAFMVRSHVFDEIGYFDEEAFPQHLGEGDFCRRAMRGGFRVVMAPRASIWHDVPRRNWPYRGVRDLHMNSAERAYYVARSRILFMRKYAGSTRLVVFSVAFLPAISLAHVMIVFKERRLGNLRPTFAKSYLRGLVDGFLGNPSPLRDGHGSTRY
jgi:GT2 family glycosyltransferase